MEEKNFQRERHVKEITGYRFKNPDLLQQAFTHRSFPNRASHNDRMEYLGDAVLGQLMAKKHYCDYPDLSSEDLTELRKFNVDMEKLARVAIKYNLHNHMLYQIDSFKEQVEEFRSATLEYPLHSLGCIFCPKVLADLVEALIGAIYIDSNFSMERAWKAVRKMLQPLITPETIKIHPVTKFNELHQKKKFSLTIVDNWETTGEIEYLVGGKFVGKGKCIESKKIAKNKAAYNAYDEVVKILGMETTVDD